MAYQDKQPNLLLTDIKRAAAFATWLRDGELVNQLVKDGKILAGHDGVMAVLEGVREMGQADKPPAGSE